MPEQIITANFNQLTEAEAERLTILSEYCAQVIEVVGKIQRHGYDVDHNSNKHGIVSRSFLEFQLGHLETIIYLMEQVKDVNVNEVHSSAETKAATLGATCHHQSAEVLELLKPVTTLTQRTEVV